MILASLPPSLIVSLSFLFSFFFFMLQLISFSCTLDLTDPTQFDLEVRNSPLALKWTASAALGNYYLALSIEKSSWHSFKESVFI